MSSYRLKLSNSCPCQNACMTILF